MKKYSILAFGLILFAFNLAAASSAGTATSETSNTGAVNASYEPAKAEESFEQYVNEIYDINDLRRLGLQKDIFKRAMVGFHNLKSAGKVSSFKSIISIIDFNKSGKNKRLWIIDLKTKKLLYHALVAHGQGSGGDKPFAFSNAPDSHKSSIGFYVTGSTYFGKHGLSLKLDGHDAGFNTNARNRAIVVHGADYVSNTFIKQNGYLGRSHGCPVVSEDLNKPIINTIKDKTVLYIEGPVKNYSSTYLNKERAIAQYYADTQSRQAGL